MFLHYLEGIEESLVVGDRKADGTGSVVENPYLPHKSKREDCFFVFQSPVWNKHVKECKGHRLLGTIFIG